jgi:PAS domain-containing protein
MSQSTAGTCEPLRLRDQAQQRLSAGMAPPTRGFGVGVDALSLLHRLAGAPDSAADALQLLHELQVHQVELDLQQAQLEASECELNEGLSRYRNLYECAPVAYFVLDARAQVLECNRAGAALLGARADEIRGRRFAALVDEADRMALEAMLESLALDTTQRLSCVVHPAHAPLDSERWHLSVSAEPASADILMVVTHSPAQREPE